jgi:hypothetical protein
MGKLQSIAGVTAQITGSHRQATLMDGSDWVHLDPSGVDLERAWKETLAEFGADAEFERIGLTPQQVEQFDLARFAIARKQSDSRSDKYKEVYGDWCWELDAIDPARLIEAIDADIRQWLDEDAWQEVEDRVERQRKASRRCMCPSWMSAGAATFSPSLSRTSLRRGLNPQG